ncbi:MAG: DUF357 domain-containing protein [Candidatus Diapherotrites archaeon]|nr:DUF357 domain-containing protein [Candidatus Diapherotrites archaeon]
MGESAEEKARRYISITEAALGKVEILPPPGSELRPLAEKLLDMASRYLSDARYFLEKGDPLTALAAASYAHAWIDVAVVLGLLKGEDPKIFMVEP